MQPEAQETKPYRDFSSQLHGRMAAQRVPANATIEVTRRCPLQCVHCYNNLPMGDVEARRGELSFDEHCKLLDQMADAGCLWLLYTGGEIFGRKDFLDIYTYAKKKGFLIPFIGLTGASSPIASLGFGRRTAERRCLSLAATPQPAAEKKCRNSRFWER